MTWLDVWYGFAWGISTAIANALVTGLWLGMNRPVQWVLHGFGMFFTVLVGRPAWRAWLADRKARSSS